MQKCTTIIFANITGFLKLENVLKNLVSGFSCVMLFHCDNTHQQEVESAFLTKQNRPLNQLAALLKRFSFPCELTVE